jgi:hypothetical protein
MVATWSATLWYDDIEPVTHATLGLARMLWQYRSEQPRLQGFLEAFLNDCQSIEDVTLQVLTGRWPLTAIGVQLDTLGKIVGQERGTLTDDQYRLYILARIMVNKGNGRVEELIDICEILGCETIYVDEGTAEIRIDVSGVTDGNLIGDLISDAKAGGVRLTWIWNAQDDTDCFQMASTLGADDTDATTGFGDLTGATQTTGGYFSGTTTEQ